MTLCRTVEEVRAAAAADHDGPLGQQQMDLAAAIILAARQDRGSAA